MRGTSSFLFVVVFLQLLSVSAFAQDSSDKVRVTVYPARTAIAPGDNLRIAVILDHENDWHIHTNKPVLPPELEGLEVIATAVTASGDPDILEIHTNLMGWPEPFEAEMGFGGPLFKYGVFHERAIAYLPVTISEDASYGETTISFKVTFQACDESECLPPSTVSQNVTISITPIVQAQSVDDINLTIFSSFPESAWETLGRDAKPDLSASGGFNLLWIIIGAGFVLVVVVIFGAKMVLG